MTSSVVYQRKCALIIGINDYQYDPLKYCINDAKDLNTTLQRIGFETTLKLNCNCNDFDHTINRFTETVQSNDLVLIYFAGHGKQMEDQNYLLPVDYDYDHRGYERDYIGDHAINVQYITKKIDKTKCRITIYIFDCCRQFVRTRAVNMNQGLLPMHAPLQTLIVFACAPGKSVLEETRNDRNGSFIENLLEHIETPNIDIEEIMRNVAHDVYTETCGVQLLYRTSSFTEKVYLVTNNIAKINKSHHVDTKSQKTADNSTYDAVAVHAAEYAAICYGDYLNNDYVYKQAYFAALRVARLGTDVANNAAKAAYQLATSDVQHAHDYENPDDADAYLDFVSGHDYYVDDDASSADDADGTNDTDGTNDADAYLDFVSGHDYYVDDDASSADDADDTNDTDGINDADAYLDFVSGHDYYVDDDADGTNDTDGTNDVESTNDTDGTNNVESTNDTDGTNSANGADGGNGASGAKSADGIKGANDTKGADGVDNTHNIHLEAASTIQINNDDF